MKLRTLILDDDQPARARVRSLLAEEDDVEVIDSSPERLAPIAAIHWARPHLVFLEVGSCGSEGLEILGSLDGEQAPMIIIMAPCADHALAAFEAHALDYLLKPVGQDRLKRSLQRARDYREGRANGQVRQRQIRLLHDLDSAPQYLTRVKVKASDRILFLKVEQIDWIEAADNYVVLHSGKQTHMLREKLSALENALDPERFFRISRSTLVNVHRISELRSMFKGEHMVILADGSRLPMTRGISELEELVAFS